MIRKNRRRTLPGLPPKAPAELRPLFAAIVEILETGEGVRGDKLDRKLTLRDMLDGGVAHLKVPGNPDAGIVPPTGTKDMSVPPRPIGFAAHGSFFGAIHLTWARPHEQYNNHSLTKIYRSEQDNFAEAEVIGLEPGMFYSDIVRDDAVSVDDPLKMQGYYYWITFVTESNVEGPPNSPDGTYAEPMPDAEYLLGQLSGQLGESELGQSLKGRIDKIDGPETMPGSVAQRLSAESAARIQALKDQNASINTSIAAEREDRIAAIAEGLGLSKGYTDARITVEQTARSDGFEALAQQIELIEAGLGDDYTVGMAIEKQARISGDAALASRIDTMTAYAEGTAADLVTERQVRAAKDSALASDITQLYVESDDIKSTISIESQARIDGDAVLSSIQQVISAANAVGSAALKVSSEVFISENESMASKTESLRVSTGASISEINNSLQVLTNTGAAQAGRIDDLKVETENSVSQIRDGMLALSATDSAHAQRLSITESKTAAAQESADEAKQGVIDNTALVHSEVKTLTDLYGSLSEHTLDVQATALQAKANADQALLDAENKTNAAIIAAAEYADLQALAAQANAIAEASGDATDKANAAQAEAEANAALDASNKANAAAALANAAQQTADDAKNEVSEVRANVQINTQAVAEVDGKVSAQHTIHLDVNGYVSGYGSYNDGTTADFAVLADRFWIAQPGKPNSATNPFMVVDGINYLDTAFIRDASIESGKLGPITFGKIFDEAGSPVTTVGGLLRADMLDVDNLRVGNQNISGDITSTDYIPGQSGWKLSRDGGIEFNSTIPGYGRVQLNNNGLYVYDEVNSFARVEIGRLL